MKFEKMLHKRNYCYLDLKSFKIEFWLKERAKNDRTIIQHVKKLWLWKVGKLYIAQKLSLAHACYFGFKYCKQFPKVLQSRLECSFNEVMLDTMLWKLHYSILNIHWEKSFSLHTNDVILEFFLYISIIGISIPSKSHGLSRWRLATVSILLDTHS